MKDEHMQDDASSWALLNRAVTRAMREQGYEISRMPGRGRSNVWSLLKAGSAQTASVRTSRDRWFAFVPLDEGSRWKTLDEVDLVFVAAVNDRDNPESIEVYRFPANEVRDRFDRAYKARIKAGKQVTDTYGMWVGLDPRNTGQAIDIGAGLSKEYPAIATYPLGSLSEDLEDMAEEPGVTPPPQPDRPATIADVLAGARDTIAALAGVRREAVKLDLKIEH